VEEHYLIKLESNNQFDVPYVVKQGSIDELIKTVEENFSELSVCSVKYGNIVLVDVYSEDLEEPERFFITPKNQI